MDIFDGDTNDRGKVSILHYLPTHYSVQKMDMIRTHQFPLKYL